ncbi:hypothetical protein EYF80_038755 [Liparis tanakae]|uniref:Uncharacterized protein n=1 Tax=Liparis tanakae TaxID=230148 RepID=A0A4Z2GD14_9TELE|nr:hypothetical protein EYF80_038755 [Liparis tanakae]
MTMSPQAPFRLLSSRDRTRLSATYLLKRRARVHGAPCYCKGTSSTSEDLMDFNGEEEGSDWFQDLQLNHHVDRAVTGGLSTSEETGTGWDDTERSILSGCARGIAYR